MRRILIWPITRLIPFDRNPRTHSDERGPLPGLRTFGIVHRQSDSVLPGRKVAYRETDAQPANAQGRVGVLVPSGPMEAFGDLSRVIARQAFAAE